MRNLKKFLALVLAMMMVFSLMVTANAATTFKDDDKISDDYKDAAQILQALKVYEGDGTGNMDPKGDFERDMLATLAYRVGTGNVNDKAELYVGTGPFTDVTETHWANGYVNYAYIAEWVHGETTTTYNPSGKVTGFEVLAILLQILGYGKQGEFIGPEWKIQTARFAHDADITYGLSETTLSSVAKREEVAQMVCNALFAPIVVYSADAKGYIETDTTLGFKYFGLISDYEVQYGNWGDPVMRFYYNANKDSLADATTKTRLTDIPFTPVWGEKHDAFDQCDLAADMGWKVETTISEVYTNGKNNKSSVTVDPLNTKAMMGGTGRTSTLYDINFAAPGGYVLVYKDTYLAEVTKVTNRTYDRAGHLDDPAHLYLDIFDGRVIEDINNDRVDLNYTSVDVENTTADWTYKVGDMVLVHAWQQEVSDKVTVSVGANVTGVTYDVSPVLGNKSGGYPTGEGVARAGSLPSASDGRNSYVEVLDVADSITGPQTIKSWNSNTHTIDKDYNDNIRYHLDAADTTVKISFNWYLDTYGNVIGSAPIGNAYGYGVITRIWYAHDLSNGDGVARANVTYVDGTTATIDIGTIALAMQNGNASAVTNATGRKIAANAGAEYTDLAYTSMGAGTDTVIYAPIRYSRNDGEVMKFGSDGTKANAFYVSSDWGTNQRADIAQATATLANGDGLHVLFDHMFRFTTLSDGTYLAEEVAGNGTNSSYNKNDNYVRNNTYTGMGNAEVPMKKNTMVNNDSQGSGLGSVLVDSGTVFLIREGNSPSNYSWKSVTGVANIGEYDAGEVDFVDCDNDVYAEFVYIIKPDKSGRSLNLFVPVIGDKGAVPYYYDGSYYYIDGYVDGVPGQVKVPKAQSSTIVAPMTSSSNAYKIFVVKTTSSGVLEVAWDGNGSSATQGVAVPADATAGSLNAIAGSTLFGSMSDAGLYKDQWVVTKSGSASNSYNNGVLSISGPSSSVDRYLIGSTVTGDWNKYVRTTDTVSMLLAGADATNGDIVSSSVMVLAAYLPEKNTDTDYVGGVVNPTTAATSATGVNTTFKTVPVDSDVVKGLPKNAAYVFDVIVAADGTNPTKTLYFPYTSAATNALFTLTYSDGTVVDMTAKTGLTVGEGSYFYLDYSALSTQAFAGAGTTQPTTGLKAGTYTFTIVSGGTTVSTGTFTLRA